MPAPCDINFMTVDTTVWTAQALSLASGDGVLAGLWGEADCVRIAVRDAAAGAINVLALPCPDGRFPSVARHHLPALRLERTIADIFGLISDGIPDPRPWLDHGKWAVRHPSANNPQTEFTPTVYGFLPSEGESLHQIPV